MTNNLEEHVQFAIGYNGSLVVICTIGMALNLAMLYLFFSRKQVRRSVYTTYMVQIAITDAAVCVLWLVMATLRLLELSQPSPVDEDTSKLNEMIYEIDEKSPYFFAQRLTYAMYYFHYYNNIFLLATMSVERCVAVLKSLRCQRYQYNKNFIYAVSVVMWLVALACSLPSFIDPTLITSNEKDGISSLPPTVAISECGKLLLRAEADKADFVSSCCGVHVSDCLDLFAKVGDLDYGSDLTDDPLENSTYSESGEDIALDEDTSDADSLSSPFDEQDGGHRHMTMSIEQFRILWLITSQIIKDDVETDNWGDMVCDPNLSQQAKIYQILVNIVIGFFIPYLAIVVSNLSIACVIRVRAKYRLEVDGAEEAKKKRRVSEFLRQFSQGFSRSESESYRRGSPIVRRNLNDGMTDRHQSSPNRMNRKEYTMIVNPVANGAKTAPVKPLAPSSTVKTRDAKLRLSTAAAQLRRTSGGSGSSAESFLTDVTSLHTSPSPGVRLSAPLFGQAGDGRALVQRACSADSTASGGQNRPISARRWSSEVFRSSEGKKMTLTENKKLKDEAVFGAEKEDKFSSMLPSRGECSESTQELLGSCARLYATNSSKHGRHPLNEERSRAYSSTSRTSAVGTLGSNAGTLRETIGHKHASKQMRVSRTVLSFVIIFSICWLPQRIVSLFYISEVMIGQNGHFCNVLHSCVRLLSFFSVLLNPIVYVVTQRELRHLVRRKLNSIGSGLCLRKRRTATRAAELPRDENNKSGDEVAAHRNGSNEMSRQTRHDRHRERRSRIAYRLGRPGFSASGLSTYDKPSDGTIDEEREDEKGPSSKGHSSSNSNKTNNANGWQQFIGLVDVNSDQCHNHSNGDAETIV